MMEVLLATQWLQKGKISNFVYCHIRFFPHIFVWGSCFWFCIPGAASGCRRLLPPPPLHLPYKTLHTITSHTIILHTITSHTETSRTFVTCHLSHHNFVTYHLSHHNFTPHLSHTITSHTHTGVALGDIHLRFTSFCVAGVALMALGGALGPDLSPVTPRPFAWQALALGDIHLDITWQAWHNRASTVVLRGRRFTHGTGWCPRARFRRAWRPWRRATSAWPAWPAWHLVTSTLISRGRRGTISHPRSFCVAGVALGDIHRDITWQAWHNRTSTVVLRGRRFTHGTGWRPWARFRRAWRPWRRATSAWQAWHLVTSTLISCGRCGTIAHPWSFCVAGVALGDIHLDITWQAWHNRTSNDAARLCVAGVAFGDIHLDFARQAWHNLTATVVATQT